MPLTRTVCLGVLMTLIFGAIGCSRGPEMAEVSGVLKRAGKPLKNVRVEFWPEGDGPKSSGVTDAEGKYVLKTVDGVTSGAVVGPHRVILKDLDFYGDEFLGRKAENMPVLNKNAKERFVKDYENANVTPLKKTVESGKPNSIDLELP
ncbi:MAG: hypothetical protein ACRC8S_00500 [Fimbriiglobus sp.]